MADITDRYVMIADVADAIRSAQKWEKAAKKSAKETAKALVTYQMAADAALKVARALGDELVKGIKANLEYQRTNVALARALRDSGHEVENNVSALNRQSSELEQVSGISDEVLRKLQAMALNYGVGADKLDTFIKATIRLNRATGGRQSLEESFSQLTKTLTGVAEETIKMVPGVKDLTKEQLLAGKAFDLINEKMASNLELADNMDGTVTGLTTSWDSFTEALTKSATESETTKEALKKVKKELDGITNAFNNKGFWRGMLALQGGLLRGAAGLVTGGRSEDLLALLPEGEDDAAGAPTGPTGKTDGQKEAPKIGGLNIGKGLADQEKRAKERRKMLARFRSERQEDELVSEREHQERLREEWLGIQEHNQEEFASIQDRLQELKKQYGEDDLEYQRGLSEIINRDQELASEQRLAIAEKEAEEKKQIEERMARTAISHAQSMTQASIGILFQLLEGSESSFDQLMKAFLKSQGQRLIASGTAHAFEAAALTILTPGNPQGPALAAMAAAEIAAGAAMTAGSAVLQGPSSSGSKGSSSSAGGGVGGSGGRSSNKIQSTDVTEHTTVNIWTMGKWGQREVSFVEREMSKGRSKGYR